MKKCTIHTPMITVQQFLKFSGAAATGGEAKEWIQTGKVSVNGNICTQRGHKIRAGEIVSVNGEEYEVVCCVSDCP